MDGWKSWLVDGEEVAAAHGGGDAGRCDGPGPGVSAPMGRGPAGAGANNFDHDLDDGLGYQATEAGFFLPGHAAPIRWQPPSHAAACSPPPELDPGRPGLPAAGRPGPGPVRSDPFGTGKALEQLMKTLSETSESESASLPVPLSLPVVAGDSPAGRDSELEAGGSADWSHWQSESASTYYFFPPK